MRKILIWAVLALTLIACLLALLGLQGRGSGSARVEGHVYMIPYRETYPALGSYPARKVVISFERQGASRTIFDKRTFEVTTDSTGRYSITLPAATYLVQAKGFWSGAYHLSDWDVGPRELVLKSGEQRVVDFALWQLQL